MGKIDFFGGEISSLIDLSLQMPSSMKIRGSTLKYVMKKALVDVLPNEILHRKKRGFGRLFRSTFVRPFLTSFGRPYTE